MSRGSGPRDHGRHPCLSGVGPFPRVPSCFGAHRAQGTVYEDFTETLGPYFMVADPPADELVAVLNGLVMVTFIRQPFRLLGTTLS